MKKCFLLTYPNFNFFSFKKNNTILSGFELCLIFLINLSLVLTGCQDSCEEVTCENGGICMNGVCVCPGGHTAADCDLFSPTIEWERNFGGKKRESPSSIQQTKDGGYIAAGYTRSNNGDVSENKGKADFWIIKLDSIGNLVWERSFGGTKLDDASSIQQTKDGGFIVAGYSKSNNGDVSENNGSFDCWIIKLDATGNLEWEKIYGESFSDEVNSIKQTADGGYIVAGKISMGNADYWVAKLNNTGTIEWENKYGDSDLAYAYEILQTNDGGYIVAGSSPKSESDMEEENSGQDYWIVKLDVFGNIEWENHYGGSRGDWCSSIQQTTDSGYIVVGYSESNDGDVDGNNGGFDAWIVKLDHMGNLEWQKNLGGSKKDYANSIQQTFDGGYIVAGSSKSNDGDVGGNNGNFDAWIVKLDYMGNLEWGKNFGGSKPDGASYIQQTTDGGFIIAGASKSKDGDVNNNNGRYDFWIIKLAPQ